MRLTDIGLVHFRNLASTRLGIPPSGAVLVGANGQGKTNFLEAIHYLALFRSFRATRHSEVIAFGRDHFRVEGRVEYGDGWKRTVAVAATATGGAGRTITVDGDETGRPADAIGTIVTVLAAPDDLALVVGPPSARRRWLDAILAVSSRPYLRALQDYHRALRQRNELLRQPSGRVAGMLEPWEAALVTAGTPIVSRRRVLIDGMAARFAELGARIAGPGEGAEFDLAYRPSIESVGGGETWREKLAERRELDCRRGWTSVGPHRDEIVLRLGGRPVARYGSQGERRTAALVLRLMEAEILEAETGHRPILLLDDVFSELDPDRAERFLESLGEGHQRFITSPRPLPWLDDSLERWPVERGRIGA